MGGQLLEQLLLLAREGLGDAGLVLRDELLGDDVHLVGAVRGHDLPRGRDEERLDVRGRKLLEPRNAEGDARESAAERCELRRLGQFGERARDDDPERILGENARAGHGRRHDEVDLGDADGARQAIEERARGVAAARADAVTRGDTEIGEVGAEQLRLDAGDGGRHLQHDVAPLVREHVRDERRAVEARVVPLERLQASRAEPLVPSVVEVPADGAELADDECVLALALRVQRPLEEFERGGGIRHFQDGPRVRHEHRHEHARRFVVGAEALVGARELEPRLVERGVHLHGFL